MKCTKCKGELGIFRINGEGEHYVCRKCRERFIVRHGSTNAIDCNTKYYPNNREECLIKNLVTNF